MSYGYSGEVLLPVEIIPPATLAADSVIIRGTLEWLECADVCLPGSSALRLSLPVRPDAPARGPAAASFDAARSRVPGGPEGWEFDAAAGPRAVSLTFQDRLGLSPRTAYLFVDRPLVVDYAAPQGFERVERGYRVTVPPAPNAPGVPERLTGVLVLEGRAGPGSRAAVRVDVPVTPGDPAPAPVPSGGGAKSIQALAAVVAVAGLGLAVLLLRRTYAYRRKE